MTIKQDHPPAGNPPVSGGSDALSEHVNNNIDSIVAFEEREHGKLSGSERRLAHVSDLIGRPLYLLFLLLFVALWTTGNLFGRFLGVTPFDPPPFPLLQGILTLAALLTTTAILIRQNRQARRESQRAHLDLQVNLLTEQKVTKLIHLMEELRRDMPNVRNREDPEATALQARTDTTQVLSALAGVGIGTSAGNEVTAEPGSQ